MSVADLVSFSCACHHICVTLCYDSNTLDWWQCEFEFGKTVLFLIWRNDMMYKSNTEQNEVMYKSVWQFQRRTEMHSLAYLVNCHFIVHGWWLSIRHCTPKANTLNYVDSISWTQNIHSVCAKNHSIQFSRKIQSLYFLNASRHIEGHLIRRFLDTSFAFDTAAIFKSIHSIWVVCIEKQFDCRFDGRLSMSCYSVINLKTTTDAFRWAVFFYCINYRTVYALHAYNARGSIVECVCCCCFFFLCIRIRRN